MSDFLRWSRQDGLVPSELTAGTKALVVGVGAVGRQVALQLACMGVGDIVIMDNDTVEIVNLAPQMYPESALGLAKVDVTAEHMYALNSQVRITPIPARCGRSSSKQFDGRHVFMCVDSIETRGLLFEVAKTSGAKAVYDARLSGESMRMITSLDPANDEEYAKTIFKAEDAYRGSCTAKMTVYCATLAASVIVAKFAQNIRGAGGPGFTDMAFNAFAWEMS